MHILGILFYEQLMHNSHNNFYSKYHKLMCFKNKS